MDAYLDASGDEGFKFGKGKNPSNPKAYGSSRYYVVAAVMLFDPGPISTRIDSLRSQLEMPPDMEFKFSALSNTRRYAFFAALDSFDFELHMLVVWKKAIWSPRLRNDGTWFRQFFYKMLLASPRTPLSRSLVRIDASDVLNAQIEEANNYLMGQVNDTAPRVRKLEFIDSRDDNLIQAADMCAGAIRHSYEQKKSNFRKLVQNKIKDEWVFR